MPEQPKRTVPTRGALGVPPGWVRRVIDRALRQGKLIPRLGNAAIAWDDIRVPLETTKIGGVQDPTYEKWNDNGAGSTGINLYSFAKNSADTVFFTAQVPHTYLQGSDIIPHVHWMPAVGIDVGDVVFTMEYIWLNINGASPANSTIITVTDQSDGVADKHQLTDFAAIDGTGKLISSMIFGRFERTVKLVGVGGFDDKIWIPEIDFHHQIDSFGSNTEDSKT